jgi:hypothetical protein
MGKKNENRFGAAKRPYKASGSLVLNGALSTLQKAKTYHALLVLAAGKNWKYDERGRMVVSVNDLHRLTKGTCGDWDGYRDVLDEIRKTAELDWDHLSNLSRGRFSRSGKVPLLSESHVERDLAGKPAAIVFRISQDLVEDLIKPHWYGQVDTKVLFSIHSNYAFHAYLYACLTVVEKDANKDEFFSNAHDLNTWREILGVPEGTYKEPSKMRAFVFRRVEEKILEKTKEADVPLKINWVKTTKGFYQMRVCRLKQISAITRVERPQELDDRMSESEREERRKIEAEARELQEKILQHPKAREIIAKLGPIEQITRFALVFAADELGLDPDDF